ncbi:MAG TPA: hypothetical protein PK668_01865 [Myxococcota bacterium]|nr:hypothetical protein [Myxococcota bacterium]HRY94686.1 hypothetical protein [Myxococcota bacterium]HSA23595.1 hypothetical protein [Myxococcota bacterium]
MISKRYHWGVAPLAFAALAVLALGCGTKEACVPCTGDDPETVDVEPGTGCPDFGGDYVGTFSGSSSSCTDEPVLQGDVMVEVTTDGTAGKLSTAGVSMRMTDQEGNWTRFEGTAQVCAENETLAANPNADPGVRTYRFAVQYSQVDGTQRVTSRLFGLPAVVVDENGTVTARSFTASYSATKTDTEDPAQNCQLRATLTASGDTSP